MKIVLVVLFVLLTSACSMRRLAMNYHSYLAARTADNFLDLNSKQEEDFKKHWASFSLELSKANVELIAQKIEDLGGAEIPSEIFAGLERDFEEVLVAGCREFSPLMAQLNPNQISYLKRKIDERNKKFDPKENGGLIEYRKKMRNEMRDRMHEWLGDVSKSQERMIRDFESSKDDLGQWENNYLLYSREAQEAFLTILRASNGESEVLQKKCAEFVRSPDSFLSETSRQIKNEVAQYRRHSMRVIFASITTEQRIHLVDETKKLAQDLRGWASGVIEKK